ncbi:MAG: hypothetical protein L0H84_13420 [Pseudonocardia sp.]|nr:hypothetical protein [Pseudonocardia sp.]
MRTGSVARGGALATLSAVLAAAGHVAGGGTLGDLTLLVVLLPLLAMGFTSAAGACRSAAGTIAVLGAGQVVLHEAMVLLHPSHHAASARGPAALDAPALDTPALDTPAMLGMHAAVTLVTALALWHADRATAALLDALCRVLPRRQAPLPARRPLRTFVLPRHGSDLQRTSVLAASVSRRGPPVTC